MSLKLFTPLKLGELELQNRVVVSPMCQYSAEHGVADDWHIMHIGQFAVSNPGLIFLEGTAVAPDGRISTHDLCLYNEDQTKGVARIVDFVKRNSHSRIGVQLFHAGRKGSQHRPWDNGAEFDQGDTIGIEEGGWQVSGPSALPYSPGYPTPKELSTTELEQIKAAFVTSTLNADRAGIDTVELHYAHGYLLHLFLSEVSNQRTDEYGGSLENRMRFPLEVFHAVKDVWPSDKPIGARVSGNDFGTEEGAWDVRDAVVFAKALEEAGCDYLDVSGGFLSPEQDFFSSYGPGFQAALALEVKANVGVPVLAVGVIAGAHQAEQLLNEERADAVSIARGMLYDPRWTWHAAHELGAKVNFPPQYERAFSYGYPDMFHQIA